METIDKIKKYSKTVTVSAALISTAALGAAQTNSLSEFPNMLIDDEGETDTAVVVGDEARTIDVVGGIDIAESIGAATGQDNDTDEFNDDDENITEEDNNITENNQTEENITDDEPEEYRVGAIDSDQNIDQRVQEQNIVLVGGPSVNGLTQMLANEHEEVPGPEEYEEGTATIQLVEDAFTQGYDAIIVAGYEGEDTRQAANYLADYSENLEELEGETSINIDTS